MAQAWHKVTIPDTHRYRQRHIDIWLTHERNGLEDNAIKPLGHWQLISDPFLPGAALQYRIRVDIPSPSFMLLP